MNNENLSNIPQPDPSWDYYGTWRLLHGIKARIDEALKIMKNSENSTAEIDKEIKLSLEIASDRLIEIIDNDLVTHDDETA
ncbi:hypothetical protein [Halotia branconii]|uniref:Uncharacterized protein n=1 Tax=Halotia branconii CENA392 TaxID=1539056 RepID=A0AAJ6NMV5_9CYAN|nr:hypothetical protein [Halotia branconii]WGV23357.1 hypothetical protein QI031_16145 [Halotia branconii CENA392]